MRNGKFARFTERDGLLLMVDEIYDQILYDGAQFQPVAPLAGEHPCITFSGLSKVHRACGWRVGWAMLSGAAEQLGEFRAAMAGGDRTRAAPQMDRIRQMVTINLVLGLLTVAVAAWGRFGGQ